MSSNTVDRSYNNGRVSNNGQLYRCRSFVYDTQNQICDLYSHIGNAYPSQLIQYYGKDYYEPTGNTGNCGTSVTVTVSPPVTPVVPSQCKIVNFLIVTLNAEFVLFFSYLSCWPRSEIYQNDRIPFY